MEIGLVFLYTFIATFVLFTIFYIIGWQQKNVNTVDIAYGGGFILVAILSWILSDNTTLFTRQIITLVLVVLWGLRIAVFLTIRRFGKDEKTGEDRRFKVYRDEWGKSYWWRSFVQIYFLQVILIMIVGLPLMSINFYTISNDLVVQDYIGLGIWLIGFFFEFTADLQMSLFKRKPENKGKIMTKGLWKFSRHPNYFGEISMWVGIAIIGLFNFGVWNYIGLVSPLILALLLIFASGLPLSEKRYKDNEEYQEYKRRTNALIPWLPKK